MADEVLQNEIDSLYNQMEVQIGGLFVTNGVQHEIVKGKPAQTIRCKYDGGSFVGKLVGIAKEGKCLVGKLGMNDLRTFPTSPGKRHTLVKDWDPNDTYCAVSQSSIMSFGERSIRTSLRRDNLQLCFFDGDEWIVPEMPTHVPEATEATATEAICHQPIRSVIQTVPPTAREDFETKTVARYRYRKVRSRTNYYVMFWNCGNNVFDQSITDGKVNVIQCNRDGFRFVAKGSWFTVRLSELKNSK